MQGLKKEATFVLEVYRKYLHSEKCGNAGICWVW